MDTLWESQPGRAPSSTAGNQVTVLAKNVLDREEKVNH